VAGGLCKYSITVPPPLPLQSYFSYCILLFDLGDVTLNHAKSFTVLIK